ncbi:hypothetical protein L873DRAFT_1791600 [Choiromyces venosus 120613-1]|uniref:Uncharacterized protein n=1 Tax=Choiromyces venosus 120613-1 TaxID=1336337 RepID=A0A3N4JIB1_9PEZI|nr:hypothetical protein L873DRAFT_1791600 [Choiromyces venosus 120613-1]
MVLLTQGLGGGGGLPLRWARWLCWLAGLDWKNILSVRTWRVGLFMLLSVMQAEGERKEEQVELLRGYMPRDSREFGASARACMHYHYNVPVLRATFYRTRTLPSIPASRYRTNGIDIKVMLLPMSLGLVCISSFALQLHFYSPHHICQEIKTNYRYPPVNSMITKTSERKQSVSNRHTNLTGTRESHTAGSDLGLVPRFMAVRSHMVPTLSESPKHPVYHGSLFKFTVHELRTACLNRAEPAV